MSLTKSEKDYWAELEAVHKEFGVPDEVLKLEGLRQGLTDAVMIATTSNRMRQFVTSVMSKFGVEGDELFGLGILVSD